MSAGTRVHRAVEPAEVVEVGDRVLAIVPTDRSCSINDPVILRSGGRPIEIRYADNHHVDMVVARLDTADDKPLSRYA